MKRIVLFMFFLMLANVQLSATATECIKEMQLIYSENALKAYVHAHIFEHGHFSRDKALHFLERVQDEAAGLGSSGTDLWQAGDEAMNYLVELGQFTEQELELAYQWYSNFLQAHPELDIPVDIPAGIICLVAGTLLMATPGAQLVATGLIDVGAALISAGFAEWEKRIKPPALSSRLNIYN